MTREEPEDMPDRGAYRLRRPKVAVTMFGVLSLTSGCIETLDEEASAIGELVGDCAVPTPSDIQSLGAPASLEYPDGSLWIWEELETKTGELIPNVAAFVTSADEACEHAPNLVRDEDGDPVSLLSLNAEEIAANANRSDGRRLRLVATGGFVYGGTAYLVYDHAIVGPGIFDIESLGSGLCIRAENAGACERLATAGDTILWSAGERILNRGGLVQDDHALLFGCQSFAAFDAICTVTGAPIERRTDPVAYQPYNVFEGWVREPERATSLFDELGAVTVSAFGDGFIAVALDIFTGTFSVRSSRDARGGFGRPIQIFTSAPTDAWFVSGGREHAGLRRSPRTIHVTYGTSEADESVLHLGSFRFFSDLDE